MRGAAQARPRGSQRRFGVLGFIVSEFGVWQVEGFRFETPGLILIGKVGGYRLGRVGVL